MNSATFFGISELSYIMAMVAYISYLVFKNKGIGIIATTVTIFGFISQTIAIIQRWVESYQLGIGHAPFSNLYESLILFIWSLILIYLIIEFRYKNRSFGAFVTPIAGLTIAFIDLTGMAKEIQPLVPALKSNWLLAHVIMSFISYAAFALSFSTAIMYLIVSTEKKKEASYIFWTITIGLFLVILIAMGFDFLKFRIVTRTPEGFIKGYLFKATFLNPSSGISLISWLGAIVVTIILWRYGYLLRKVLIALSISTDALDEITYKSIAFGFPVFTVGGLIFGAIWAAQAWGTYWSWDPKETWSLITWLAYAIYLHARLMRGWRGKRVAILAVLGFIAVIFTYLGVNLLLSGLHSYGEL